MDQNDRLSLITAAANATGPMATYESPQAWQTALTMTAIELAAMADDASEVSRVLNGLTAESTKKFVGTVLSVVKEPRSTRGLVTLNTGTDRLKDGVNPGEEQVRTDRMDTPLGLAMGRKTRDLIGHRVLVYIEMESFSAGGDTKKVRVLRHIVDLGVDPKAGQVLPGAAA